MSELPVGRLLRPEAGAPIRRTWPRRSTARPRRGDGDRPRPAADHHPGRDHGRGVPIPGARAGRFWLS